MSHEMCCGSDNWLASGSTDTGNASPTTEVIRAVTAGLTIDDLRQLTATAADKAFAPERFRATMKKGARQEQRDSAKTLSIDDVAPAQLSLRSLIRFHASMAKVQLRTERMTLTLSF